MATGGAATAALLKVGMGLLERTVPRGISGLWAWWKSKKVVVVGQARAGKTTFIDYFRHNIFEDEKPRSKTYDEERTASFTVAFGANKTLEATLQTVIDVPGQYGPAAHAKIAFDHRPHGVLAFMDLTAPLDGEVDRAARAWLKEFCQRLETHWRSSGRKNTKLQSLIVVMNKRDKVEKKVEERYGAALRSVVQAELREALGTIRTDVEVLPCSVVKNRHKTELVDAVIKQLLKDLAK